MKRIVAICLCLVISSVCRAQVGYQGQSAISFGASKTNYGVMADLRFVNQVTPRSAVGGEVVYNREQLSTTDDADFNAQQVLVGVVYQYPILFGRLGFFPAASCLIGGEFADKTTSKGDMLSFSNGFAFGVSVNIPVGVVIGKRFTVYADPGLLYIPSCNFVSLILSFWVGLLFYFLELLL